jgi:hypothetical protein
VINFKFSLKKESRKILTRFAERYVAARFGLGNFFFFDFFSSILSGSSCQSDSQLVCGFSRILRLLGNESENHFSSGIRSD